MKFVAIIEYCDGFPLDAMPDEVINLMRLMYSGRDFAWLYPRQDQTCFLDGHVRAFAHLGFRHFPRGPHRQHHIIPDAREVAASTHRRPEHRARAADVTRGARC